jgi:16S rRNA (guanine527-N7)-methyltransferase
MNDILKYFDNIPENQMIKFELLFKIYFDWNQKINLISRKDFDAFYIHHVLHSLAIAKYVDFKEGTKVLDLGTGGGFPGIPLAIYFEKVDFLAVDSIQKKIMVVNDVIEQLELKNISAKAARVETLKEPVDFIVTRAVAPLDELLRWTKHLYHPISFNKIDNGLIALKGGDLTEEIKESKRKVSKKSILDYFNEPFFETKQIVYVPHKRK